MRVLVTGGGGFLGSAIVRQLLERGIQVRSFQRSPAEALHALGAEIVRGDLCDAQSLTRATAGCDAVMHVAAKAGVWGSAQDYQRVNVQGTQNVVAACREQGIPRLVYTSSPSVVFDGHDENGINESAPYPDTYLAHYPRTKAEAERFVLAANDPKLATVALRPHLIWGPGDPHLVPRILERARAGRLRLVGDGQNLVDSTFVENAAQAHLLALDSLAGDASCAGKAYFISNGQPLPMGQLLNRILAAGQLPPVTKSISPGMAYAAGAVFEAVYRTLRIRGEPPMTRFVARQLSTTHWFDLSAARHDLGYDPHTSIDQGMQQLAAWLNAE
jgi:nucleoside-diphosphate-sugar epimerase